MASPFEKLAPVTFSKIAQNDNMQGQILAAVYRDNLKNEFFVQVLGVNDEFITLGPMPGYIFANLCQILSDVKDMEGKYLPLE